MFTKIFQLCQKNCILNNRNQLQFSLFCRTASDYRAAGVFNISLVKVAAKFYRHLQKMPAFFYETWKIQGPCMETFCSITMQLSLFKLKLKTFPILHHRDHFVFTRKFLKQLPFVNTISQIAR